jgi:hypothetical protein
MNLALALAVVLGAVTLAVLLLTVVRRRLSAPVLNDPGRGAPMITLVGTAFAVLLAFLTVAAFGTYNGAKAGAESEAVAVLELARTAALFPPAERDELRADLVCYGRAVAEHEWPAMRDGERSVFVDQWISEYRDLFARLSLGSVREQLAFEELLTEARARTDARRERLTQATPSVPAPLWLVLGLGGLVTILFQLALADPRERLLVQSAMIAGVTVVVSAGLLLVNFLDHPYDQLTGSIEPTEMRQTLTMIDEAAPGLVPPCAADGAPTSSSG